MNIFQKMGGLWDDARIAMAFTAYEKEARARHLASAARRFSVAELQADAARRMAGPQAIAEQRFVAPISALNGKAAGLQTQIATCNRQLATFERDYRHELDALFASKSALMAECRSLNAAKSGAYADLEAAADGLNRWHARSTRTFFGNGGKQLPRHAFFGQSLGDRDCLKSQRDSAGDDIASYKQALATRRHTMDEVQQQIDRIKADRQEMFALRSQGHSARGLKDDLQRYNGHLDDVKQEVEQLQSALHEFITAAKHRTGTTTLEADIAKVQAMCDAYLRAFDTAQAVDQRKAQHRQAWREQRGK